MDYICTWFCADEIGQESIFPQTGQKSSGASHQNIYWRCLILFFSSSKRFNKNEKHLLFTNVAAFPTLDGQLIEKMLRELHVEVIYTDFKYKTPKGYFGMFQNQFYEFSILEYIVDNNTHPTDNYLILDSDCLFLKPAGPIFETMRESGFMSFEDDCSTDLVIHGLSRLQMKKLYGELLGYEIESVPGYHLGEFFMASVKNIKVIFEDFLMLWPSLINRFENDLPKFNEEAQTLSFIYYKNDLKANPARNVLKRFWTNPVFYRNVEPGDNDIAIWHLPSEKTFGLPRLYNSLIKKNTAYGLDISNEVFISLVKNELGIPVMSSWMRVNYYILSYWRAISKRVKNMVK